MITRENAIKMFKLRFNTEPTKLRKVRNKPEYNIDGLNSKGDEIEVGVRYIEGHDNIQMFSTGGWFGLSSVFILSMEDFNSINTKEELDARKDALYTIDEVVQGLEDGSFTIDTKGHNSGWNGDAVYFVEEVRDRVIQLRDDAKERSVLSFWEDGRAKRDKGKKKTTKEMADELATSGRLVETYTRFSTEKLRNNSTLGAMDSPEMHCHNCGEKHRLIIRDKVITMAPTYHQEKEGIIDTTCTFADGIPTKVVNLDIPSGDIVFQNYFRVKDQDRNDDTVYDPKEGKYGELSVCDHQGRTNLMNKLAKNGVGYGQMGNMSLSLYINPERDKIILGDCYPDDDCEATPDPEYTKAMKEGYKAYGMLSLGVWAYYCVDRSKMIEYNTEELEKGYNTIIESKDGENEDYGEQLIANVKKGTWTLTHYYDNTPDPESGRLFKYATLELVK